MMKRTQIYLDGEQDRRLGERAAILGTTKSDLIRQAVDEMLDRGDEGAFALARFKRTVEELHQGPPLDLPPGEDYVEELRAVGAGNLDELNRRWRSG